LVSTNHPKWVVQTISNQGTESFAPIRSRVPLQHLMHVANTMEKFQPAVEPDQHSLHSQDSVARLGRSGGTMADKEDLRADTMRSRPSPSLMMRLAEADDDGRSASRNKRPMRGQP